MSARRKEAGRVSYTRELALEICKRVSDGLTIKEVSEIKGMPGRTAIYAWLADHPDFANMYARAREERADLVADEIVSIADSEADPNKARVRIDARKWWAAKVNPKVYGDKVAHIGGGPEDPPIKTDDLSNDARRVAFMLGRAVGQQSKAEAE